MEIMFLSAFILLKMDVVSDFRNVFWEWGFLVLIVEFCILDFAVGENKHNSIMDSK